MVVCFSMMTIPESLFSPPIFSPPAEGDTPMPDLVVGNDLSGNSMTYIVRKDSERRNVLVEVMKSDHDQVRNWLYYSVKSLIRVRFAVPSGDDCLLTGMILKAAKWNLGLIWHSGASWKFIANSSHFLFYETWNLIMIWHVALSSVLYMAQFHFVSVQCWVEVLVMVCLQL